MAKFYAVKVGRTPGIYTTWDDCKKQVDGFPSASYKSFKTANEAAEFLGFVQNNSHNDEKQESADIDEKIDSMSENEAIAYVDGSYNIATGDFGSGVVFIHNGQLEKIYKGFRDENLSAMRNVAGEIKASEIAISYAIEKGLKSIEIYHDYEGIAKWCTGEWKANKAGTIKYQQFYLEAKKLINIFFIKVKAHPSNKYNDMADELAKKGAGVE